MDFFKENEAILYEVIKSFDFISYVGHGYPITNVKEMTSDNGILKE